MTRWLLLTSVVLVLTSCKLGPDYERPELDLPEDFIQGRTKGLHWPIWSGGRSSTIRSS